LFDFNRVSAVNSLQSETFHGIAAPKSLNHNDYVKEVLHVSKDPEAARSFSKCVFSVTQAVPSMVSIRK
jgi:hypothetical protein